MFRFLRQFFGSAKAVSTTPFSPLFQGIDYLTLLNLPPAASPAVLSIVNVIRQNPNHRESVLTLLRDPDWRVHLVAAVAVLLSHDRADLCPAVWEAVDKGSWVSPQLAVVLSICDPEFVGSAKERIVAGPGASLVSSAKNLAALLYLVRAIPGESQWAEAIGHSPEVARVLQSDSDAGDKLAACWATALRERFAELGLSLSPPAI